MLSIQTEPLAGDPLLRKHVVKVHLDVAGILGGEVVEKFYSRIRRHCDRAADLPYPHLGLIARADLVQVATPAEVDVAYSGTSRPIAFRCVVRATLSSHVTGRLFRRDASFNRTCRTAGRRTS